MVLLHDPWVDRVRDDYGALDEYTFDELRLLRFRRRGTLLTRDDERVPRIADVLDLVKRYCGLKARGAKPNACVAGCGDGVRWLRRVASS